MNSLGSRLGRPAVRAGFISACLAVVGVPAWGAPQYTQTFTLQPGWNAIFVQVQPDSAEVPTVFGASEVKAVVKSVWSYFQQDAPVEFLQDPGEGLWNQPGWRGYFFAGEERFLSNLSSIQVNRAYLVHLGGTGNVTLSVSGRPSLHAPPWQTDSFSLLGLSVRPDTPPTFLAFFAPSAAQAGQDVYRLGTGGFFEKVATPATAMIQAGAAYWIKCEGASTYPGPLLVDLGEADGLTFGRGVQQLTLRLQNLSSVARTVTLQQLAAADPVVLAYRKMNDDTKEYEWPYLSALTPIALGAAGTSTDETTLLLAVKRVEFTAATVESVLEITDDHGGRYLLPVSAEK